MCKVETGIDLFKKVINGYNTQGAYMILLQICGVSSYVAPS